MRKSFDDNLLGQFRPSLTDVFLLGQTKPQLHLSLRIWALKKSVGKRRTVLMAIIRSSLNLIWGKRRDPYSDMIHRLGDTVSDHVQLANHILPPPTTTSNEVPIAKGLVIPPGSDEQLVDASPLTLGPLSKRVASLTHVAQPIAPPQCNLTPFYPDLLMKRITPSRHEVGAEEVAKELLADNFNATVPHRRGATESAGLPSDVRDFTYHKTENADNEYTWARLAEMTCFHLSGVGYLCVWAPAHTTVSVRLPYSGNSPLG